MRAQWRFTTVVGAGVLALATARCGEIVGADDYRIDVPRNPDAVPTCPAGSCECGGFHGVVAFDACADCQRKSCCSEGEACRARAECASLVDCGLRCRGEPGCSEGCGDLGGTPESTALLECLRGHCLHECNPCGSIMPVGASTPSEDPLRCFDCVASTCCTEHTLCLDDAMCAAYAATGAEVPSEAWNLHRAAEECGRARCRNACGLGGDWSCLGAVDWPEPEEGTIEITYVVGLFGSGEPVPLLTVRACNVADALCENPVSVTTSDDQGRAVSPVPGGFDGYWEMTGDGIVPTLVSYVRPASFSEERDFEILSADVFNGLAAAVGVEIDPGRGHLAAAIDDCSANVAPGVRFEVSPSDDAAPFYIIGGIPTLGATSTDDGGTGGVVNLAPTVVTVTAIVEGTDEQIARSSALVRAGHMSTIAMQPAP